MITLVSSPKHGTGVTVTAALLALALARHEHTVLVDLAGDQLHALGVTQRSDTGSVHVTPRLDVIDASTADIATQLDVVRGAHKRTSAVVVDAGTADHQIHTTLAHHTDTRVVWVVRCCYLTLRRAVQQPTRPDQLIVLREGQRALSIGDVEAVLGVPVAAIIDLDPAIARAVDAGLLAARPPSHPLTALAAVAAREPTAR